MSRQVLLREMLDTLENAREIGAVDRLMSQVSTATRWAHLARGSRSAWR